MDVQENLGEEEKQLCVGLKVVGWHGIQVGTTEGEESFNTTKIELNLVLRGCGHKTYEGRSAEVEGLHICHKFQERASS